jgi:hypothetical protein
MELPRTRARRTVDAFAKLAALYADVWVAPASRTGVAHLVPISFSWDGEHIILATEVPAIIIRNIAL